MLMKIFNVNTQKHNFYKLKLFELKRVNNIATVCGFNLFQLFLIFAIFSPSDCRLTAIFMRKWLIL